MRVIDSRGEARWYSRLPCSILDVPAQKYIRVGLGGSSYKLIKPKSVSNMYIQGCRGTLKTFKNLKNGNFGQKTLKKT